MRVGFAVNRDECSGRYGINQTNFSCTAAEKHTIKCYFADERNQRYSMFRNAISRFEMSVWYTLLLGMEGCYIYITNFSFTKNAFAINTVSYKYISSENHSKYIALKALFTYVSGFGKQCFR